jgi:hypothetical protein
LDDDDELPETPTDEEAALAARLGPELARIDERILKFSAPRFLKIARITLDALKDGGFDAWDEAAVDLHARRALALIEQGKLEVAGNPHRPRFSEAKLPGAHHE